MVQTQSSMPRPLRPNVAKATHCFVSVAALFVRILHHGIVHGVALCLPSFSSFDRGIEVLNTDEAENR